MAKPKIDEHPEGVFNLPIALMRAAQACVAPNKDPRELLHCISITENGWIQATDGIAMFRGRCKTKEMFWPVGKVLLKIHAKIPSSCDLCEIEWYDTDNGVLRCSVLDNDKPAIHIAFETRFETIGDEDKKILPELYPKLEEFVPKVPVKKVDRLALSNAQLKKPDKVFGTYGVIFENRGPDIPVCVYPHENAQWEQYESVLVLAQMSMLPDDESATELAIGGLLGEELDELYSEACDIAIESRKASISYLQRRLRVGYNRAARIIEQMQENGVVSPVSNSGSRTVLMEI